MALDSEAVFRGRLKAVGLDSDEADRVVAAGWRNLGSFAFSSSYSPGNPDDAPFLRDVVRRVFGETPSAGQTSALRRVYFEAFTLSAADLKKRLEQTDQDPPRKLPAAERNSRYETVKAKYPGLTLTGQLECAHSLVDRVVQMVDDSVLRYLSWEECTTREMELAGVKKIKEWRADANGVLREMVRDPPSSADVSSPLHVQWALQRRGLALEQGQLLTFSDHERWTNRMLRELTRDPPYGYQRTTLEQLHRADKEVFRRLAEETRDGLALGAGGELPLAPHFQAICNEPGVQALLLPLPEGARKRKRSRSVSRSHERRRRADRERGKKQDGKERDGGKKGDAEKRKDKDKEKDQPNKRGNPRMPKELQGQCACREDGEPICFGFNLETCSAVAAGQKCSKGWHICCKPKCGKPHPFRKCP